MHLSPLTRGRSPRRSEDAPGGGRGVAPMRPAAHILAGPPLARKGLPEEGAMTAVATPAVDVRGLVHVTGGGLPENVPRVLPAGLGARFDTGTWERHPLFAWIQEAGGVSDAEMYRTFNMSLGMVAIVPQADAARAAAAAPNGRIVGVVTETEGVELV